MAGVFVYLCSVVRCGARGVRRSPSAPCPPRFCRGAFSPAFVIDFTSASHCRRLLPAMWAATLAVLAMDGAAHTHPPALVGRRPALLVRETRVPPARAHLRTALIDARVQGDDLQQRHARLHSQSSRASMLTAMRAHPRQLPHLRFAAQLRPAPVDVVVAHARAPLHRGSRCGPLCCPFPFRRPAHGPCGRTRTPSSCSTASLSTLTYRAPPRRLRGAAEALYPLPRASPCLHPFVNMGARAHRQLRVQISTPFSRRRGTFGRSQSRRDGGSRRRSPSFLLGRMSVQSVVMTCKTPDA